MARLVERPAEITAQGDVPGTAMGVDDYFERVAKYIPVEIVGAYITLRSIAPAAGASDGWPGWLHYAMFVGLVILNVMYLRRMGKRAPRLAHQIAISCVAFLVWTYAIGGHVFDQLALDLHRDIIDSRLGGALLVFASLGFGFYDPISSSTTPRSQS